jgi:hypothetical protein
MSPTKDDNSNHHSVRNSTRQRRICVVNVRQNTAWCHPLRIKGKVERDLETTTRRTDTFWPFGDKMITACYCFMIIPLPQTRDDWLKPSQGCRQNQQVWKVVILKTAPIIARKKLLALRRGWQVERKCKLQISFVSQNMPTVILADNLGRRWLVPWNEFAC